ncbi:clathrin heavy chain linker domain-containing protein 1-like [Branchiostoma lanceolatum]|uniref:clathrin heavy chain linker domain-containing protein 1-like n=1 Tax=Branchiostoma lanceolatum TaxID=7740 RepID=UPI003454B6AB
MSNSIPGTPRRVLPPIATGSDRAALDELENSIQVELARLRASSRGPNELSYTVFKDVFDQLIQHASAYCNLLTAIKAEYEAVIEDLQEGQREAFYLEGRLKATAAEPTTVVNYRRRAEELQQKMSVIQRDNARLAAELDRVRAAREAMLKKDEDDKSTQKPRRTDFRPIPGLSLEESTDVKTLSRYHAKLEHQLKELHVSRNTKYAPKVKKQELKDTLTKQVNMRHHLADRTVRLKNRCQKLKVAVEVAEIYKENPPENHSMSDLITMALTTQSMGFAFKGVSGQRDTPFSFEDDDPNKEKEAEMLLEYIDKFHELFDEQCYQDAAIHAANSPKGILRTPETMAKFKAVGTEALLAYCEALMSSVSALSHLPSPEVCLECVRCALSQHRLDLVTHWIAQNSLLLTEEIANALCEYADQNPLSSPVCLALAQAVFTAIQAHRQVAVCMCRQGKVYNMVEYAHGTGTFHKADWAHVLQTCPSLELARSLIRPYNDQPPALQLGQAVSTLLQTEDYMTGLKLLQETHDKFPAGSSSGSLHHAVFDDRTTTYESWLHIAETAEQHGYEDVGLELLTTIIVKYVLNKVSEETASIQYLYDQQIS